VTPKDQTWTVKAILDWCEGYLAHKGDAQPRLSAQWLLGEAMGLSRIELYTNLDKPLSEEERTTMRAWVVRRGQGEPLQLICGTAPFRHMVLEVAPGVLIPRPETEVLVSEVLTFFPVPKQVSAYAFECDNAEEPPAQQQPEPIQAVDLCTGSGCIACALATEHPHMTVYALDIAPEALELAQRNVDAHHVADRVNVIKSDLLAALREDKKHVQAFDVIVSNPPYIPSSVLVWRLMEDLTASIFSVALSTMRSCF
jgi:release factor glutamine methyltransferase